MDMKPVTVRPSHLRDDDTGATTSTGTKPPKESLFELHGWRFSSTNAAAMNSDERAALTHDVLQLGPAIPLPEMVFAKNFLAVEHPSRNLKIQFEATPALMLWAKAHTGAHWDHTNFDFTYCTKYHGSVERIGDGGVVTPVAAVPTTERLPLKKLMQHVEIRHYDQVLLFEDDVRDLGEIYLEAKIVSPLQKTHIFLEEMVVEGLMTDSYRICPPCKTKRVMDFGFLVLCRYYCRVDGKQVRILDTRYYHEFGQDFIWRDHETRDATITKLRHDLYPHLSKASDDEHFRQLDFAADAVYPVLEPHDIMTEKIFFTSSANAPTAQTTGAAAAVIV